MNSEELFEKVRRAGWFPSNLCPEARAALAVPPMPARLSQESMLRIFWLQTLDAYCRRFLRGIKGVDLGPDLLQPLSALATVHVLSQVFVGKLVHGPEPALNEDDVKKWVVDMGRWFFDKFMPSWKKLGESLPELDGILSDPSVFEPALTVYLIRQSWIQKDMERSLRTLAVGQAMNEEGTVHPQDVRQTARVWKSVERHDSPVDFEELNAYMQLLSPLEKVLGYDLNGNYAFDPLSVKTALDHRIGRKSQRLPLPVCEADPEAQPGGLFPAEEGVESEIAAQLEPQLNVLPPEVRELVEEALEVLTAQEVLDGIRGAAEVDDPAMKAAALRKGWQGRVSRERLARVFGTTVDRIRGAEKKSR